MFSLIIVTETVAKFEDWVMAPYGINKVCNMRQKRKTVSMNSKQSGLVHGRG